MKSLATATLIALGAASLSLCVLPWSRPLIIAITIAALAWIATRFRKTALHPLDAVTAALVIVYGWFAARPSLWTWDNWQPTRRDFFFIWGARARLFFEHRGIDVAYLRHAPNDLAHPDYPWLWPLSMDWASIINSAFRPEVAGVLTTIFGMSLLLILRECFRDELGSRLYAAAATLSCAGLALPAAVGLAEAPYIAYSSAAVILLRRNATSSAAVLLGFAALTKNEGLALIVAVAIARRSIRALWPAFAMAVAWLAVRYAIGIPTDLFAGDVVARVREHLLHPLPMLGGFSGASTDDPWIFLAIALALAAAAPRLRRESFILTVTALQIVFFIAAYLASPLAIAGHIVSSWGRLEAQLAIPLLFAAMVSLRGPVAAGAVPQ